MAKRIALTMGFFATVDDSDYENISLHKWRSHKGWGTHYAIRHSSRKNGKRTTIYMHRQIMAADKGIYVDHINGLGLDNQKSNLRLCTNQQNSLNRRPDRGSKSGIKNIAWCSRTRKWQVSLKVGKQRVWLGRFKNKEDAIPAVNKALKKYHGDFARLLSAK